VVAGCHSGERRTRATIPATSSPPRTIRVALSDFRWPLDPALASTRDEQTLARSLYATPLRTDAAGRVVPGLCTAWTGSADFTTWRFTCRRAPAIAAALRRVARMEGSSSRWLFAGADRIAAPGPRRLVVRLRSGWRRFPFALTAVAAAPRSVAGPFRLVRGSADRVVMRRGGRTIVFRRLEPAAAVRAFRAGRVDEAPVPIGDLETLRADFDVRLRRLLGLDVVVFGRRVDPRLRRAYWQTANRGDYEALLGTSMALDVVGRADQPDPAAYRRALKAIPSLPRRVVRIARPPTLDYGADVLYGQWREAGLGPILVRAPEGADARFERLLAAYPQAEALPAALVLGDGLGPRAALLAALARVDQRTGLEAVDASLRRSAEVIPVAWATDARLISPRLRGWREDLLGNVDYSKVDLR
jgi:hypothetical protein